MKLFRRLKRNIAIALTLSLVSSALAGSHEIYISPNGSDAHPGTAAQPLATLGAARDALRASGQLGQQPCKVILQEGVYRMSEPLVLTPQDSGAEGAEVIYMAAEGAEVTLTGALTLDLNWTPWKDSIYRAKLDSSEFIDQLFVNGNRQMMARYPNKVEDRTAPFGGASPDAWDFEARGWKNPEGAFLHALHRARWGGTHFEVMGIKDGKLDKRGGWQENRAGKPHMEHRMAENIFEELDAPGEWFFDREAQWLYYCPADGVDLGSAAVDAVFELPHLIEIYGDTELPMPTMTIDEPGNGMDSITVETPVTTEPARHIEIRGLRLTGTTRTFMQTKEPLLRSDWTIYRGGAIHLRGTEDVVITDCHFDQVGGNAVFVDGYNRRVAITSNLFDRNGASDVNFVGSPAAVRNPIFSYGATQPDLETVDTEIGPKTRDYPADCLVEDNLMGWCGRVEKQPAGVNLAMASRITIRHNTIHHTPRAAINVCTGAWGGHIIEYNDCFETVLETHDHGAFNSWGRDRFWFRATPNGARDKEKMQRYIDKYPNMMLWDAYQTTILRNNRMHCDHGWDIDLDDGSGNYEIYNNLCLSGGLKTREGYYRKVYNNIIIGGPVTINVPYEKPLYDMFERNIVAANIYRLSKTQEWGGILDNNLFHVPGMEEAEPAIGIQKMTGQDAHSLLGDAQFVDPENGDFSVKEGSPALELGFVNFPMDRFGVTSAHLKTLAPEPPIRMPESYWAITKMHEQAADEAVVEKVVFMGAEVDDLDSLDELTAYGASAKSGVILVRVPAGSAMAKFGFETDDVILEVNGRPIANVGELRQYFSGQSESEVRILRGQEVSIIRLPPNQ